MKDMSSTGSDAKVVEENSRDAALESLDKLDLFSDPPPRPSTQLGGTCSLVLAAALAVYTILLTISTIGRPLISTSSVVWSVAEGPYLLPVKCYSEACYVSVTYDPEHLGGNTECVEKLDASKLGQCHVLRANETRIFEVCYSQLPGQGIRMHFGGKPLWDGSNLGISRRIERLYGLTILSASEKMPVSSPIREGTTLLTYVHTRNETYAKVQPGHDRHEWFSTLLTPSAEVTEFASDPCAENPPPANFAVSTMKHVILTMAPSFTSIVVEKRHSVLIEAFGQLGGAYQMLFYVLSMASLWLLKANDAFGAGRQKGRGESAEPSAPPV